MTKVKCTYLGNLNCEAIHLQSGSFIRTDAPLDHCGKGESFSPTDLLATSLGTCLLTIMAIKAKSKGFLLVSSTPLTRSSYHADEDFKKLKTQRLNLNATSISQKIN